MSEEKKIIVDEDWKSQVTAEKEAAEKKAEDPESAENAGPQPGMLPEASIEMLISIFVTEAMVGMGQIPHPATGQPQPSLEQSRYAIDMLEVLQEKTKGNLTDEEENTLRDLLHQLRMAFVAVQSQQQPPTPPIQTE